ncbi:MAG: hypothetical protein ISS34_03040 [Candidatus Omnitrophica bacterium]|nr:hypothetical protein [Candidatus Omnitrophota bacterium]
MDKKRSAGVLVAGITVIAFSSFNFFIILRNFLLPALSGVKDERFTVGLMGAIIGSLLNILLVVSGINIMTLKQWSRKLAIAVLAISCFHLSIVSYAFFDMLLRGNHFSPWALLKVVEFLVYIAIIFYLTRPKVKEQFK